jgi:hypothetical protein
MSFSRNNEETALPPAAGVRVRWEEIPERVLRLIEERLEARVIEARSQPGGFTPGLASILSTDDRRKATPAGGYGILLLWQGLIARLVFAVPLEASRLPRLIGLAHIAHAVRFTLVRVIVGTGITPGEGILTRLLRAPSGA